MSVEPQAIARLISAAVRDAPGVARIGRGTFGLVGTFGVDDVVPGIVVSVEEDAIDVEVHIVASLPLLTALPELAERIRDIVRDTVDSQSLPLIRQIDVAIDDLEEGRLQ